MVSSFFFSDNFQRVCVVHIIS
uniref:Uncharacterized protein n=1 Tax=Anguilla anguilla TaxID=7936 RepID=A0A0E9PR81_ANGAN